MQEFGISAVGNVVGSDDGGGRTLSLLPGPRAVADTAQQRTKGEESARVSSSTFVIEISMTSCDS